MAWHDERYSAFDCETTGVDVETDRIVQASIVSVGGGQPTRASTVLINPGVPIPEEAAAVHGITTAIAEDRGVKAIGAIPALAAQIGVLIRSGRPLVVMNARFDLTMLDRECRRYGADVPDWASLRVVDPFVLDKWLDQFRRGSRRLEATCQHYGVTLPADEAHDAAVDALAAARLAWKIMHRSDAVQGRHPEIIGRRAHWKAIRDDLDVLHENQAVWAREQAQSLRAYFEGRGEAEKAASVHEDWPVVNVREEAKT